TSMFLTVPQTHPGTPQTEGRGPWGNATATSTAMSIWGHALPEVGNFTAIVCRPIPPKQIQRKQVQRTDK
ncbi:hypothetical protein, partial [Stenotrophomonas sp.]|uniref:hypothetical protein n=1 Tax=Stenotrophomonas sp. TaxID=69392 RepID=UPI0028A839FF